MKNFKIYLGKEECKKLYLAKMLSSFYRFNTELENISSKLLIHKELLDELILNINDDKKIKEYFQSDICKDLKLKLNDKKIKITGMYKDQYHDLNIDRNITKNKIFNKIKKYYELYDKKFKLENNKFSYYNLMTFILKYITPKHMYRHKGLGFKYSYQNMDNMPSLNSLNLVNVLRKR